MTAKDENFMGYDYTEDWPVKNNDLWNEYRDLEIWEKYFTYKMVNKKSLDKKIIKSYPKVNEFWNKVRNEYSQLNGKNNGKKYYIPDPDTYSEKLQKRYRKLWSMDSLEYCMDKEDRIHGDTMNSIQTTLSRYVYLCYKEDPKYYAGKQGNGFVGCQGSLSQSLQIFMDIAEEEREEKFIKEGKNDADVKCLKEFIKYNHTLGNFIPVPCETEGGSFNKPRAATTNDFWDLTLYRIYCWYEKNDNMDEVEIETCDCVKNKDLCDLLGKNCKNVKLCVQWLKAFGSWNKFVEDNFMDMYVVNKGNKEYGIPKPLWCNDEKYEFKNLTEGEAKEIWKKRLGNNKCERTEECEQYFKNATKCIEERTEIMKKKLEKNGKL